MDRKVIILKIKYLHQKIDQECENKLKVLDECYELKKECVDCKNRDLCDLNFEDLAKLIELYKELDLPYFDDKKYDN